METSQVLNSKRARVQSIDLLRGAIMIIMAIDHVRVYSGLPAGGPTPGIFFTRWITHFCAPTFAFFAGTGALLYLRKTGSRSEVAKFLVSRGLLLMLLEVTVVRFFWMFNVNNADFTFTGVIWMLGCCMVILAAFLRLRAVTIGIIGLVIIFAQQIFHYVPNLFPVSMQASVAKYWGFFYPWTQAAKSGAAILSGPASLPSAFGLSIFYVIIPWVGVMMAGFGFGELFFMEQAKRNKLFIRIGIAATLLFIIWGSITAINDSANKTPFLFKLLGQQKYPPSQLYLLMTLGPIIALLPWAEKLKGNVADAVITVGRVPMFYYLLHLPLIHISSLIANIIRTGSSHQDWYNTVPFLTMPESDRWGLPLLYLVWAIDIIILYFACRWYARYKSEHPNVKWIKYI